jgi:hypothetical protein
MSPSQVARASGRGCLIDEIADGSIYFHQISGREAATHGDLTASA